METYVNDVRTHFEDFAVNEGMNVKRESSGGYTTNMTHMAWLSWLASKRMYEPLPVTSSNQQAVANLSGEGD